ncbi:response regulator transcription factor [Quadrisphaera sp. DSM 44207]|uniref:response regulator transcription factor n=1 Tax=Quadrisphaera sp. DSM 44207 TaxID=1881057 RepID=UPI00115FEC2C|nr:response regulator transcription factor [Quadrisphaera sp. DSM 44207]
MEVPEERSSSPSRRVVLAGLPELYGHGLQEALSAAGVGPVLLLDGQDMAGALPDALADALPVDGAALVVVPDERAEPVLALASRDGGALAVVEVTEEESLETFVTAVRRGAVGVLHTGADLDLAVETVRSAAAGRIVLPEHVARALCEPSPLAAAPQLEPRELGWLRQLGRGVTVAVLAQYAAYSEREMYRLLSKTYARLGAASRTDALLRAERWGLLDE